MSDVMELTDDNFTQVVQTEITLVDFWSPSCGPCRMFSHVINQLAEDSDGRFKVAKIDIAEHPEMAKQLRITSVPLVVVFQGGEEKQRFRGVQTITVMEDAIDLLL